MNTTEYSSVDIPVIQIGMLKKIIAEAINLKDNPEPFGRKGGYLSLYDRKKKTLVSVPVGTMNEEKEVRYFFNANEKITRVVKENTFRSFTSRDEKNGKYGGGIRLHDYAVSFSGFVELIDEAISVVYGLFHSLYYFDPKTQLNDEVIAIEVIVQTEKWQSECAPGNPFCVPLAEAVFGKKD